MCIFKASNKPRQRKKPLAVGPMGALCDRSRLAQRRYTYACLAPPFTINFPCDLKLVFFNYAVVLPLPAVQISAARRGKRGSSALEAAEAQT